MGTNRSNLLRKIPIDPMGPYLESEKKREEGEPAFRKTDDLNISARKHLRISKEIAKTCPYTSKGLRKRRSLRYYEEEDTRTLEGKKTGQRVCTASRNRKVSAYPRSREREGKSIVSIEIRTFL